MKRYFLIGYMGSGKSTLGKKMADMMGLEFIDLDRFIEQRYLKTIGELFAERGEAAFRQIEAAMLREVALFEDVFISAGGGTPCFCGNMEFMNSCGVTVYLHTPVDTLYSRLIKARAKRPVIAAKNDEELRLFIENSLATREPYYLQARLVITSPDVADKHQLTPEVIHPLVQRLSEME